MAGGAGVRETEGHRLAAMTPAELADFPDDHSEEQAAQAPPGAGEAAGSMLTPTLAAGAGCRPPLPAWVAACSWQVTGRGTATPSAVHVS